MKYILYTPKWLVKSRLYKNKCNVCCKATCSMRRAHWKRTWCWKRLKAKGEGGGRGWQHYRLNGHKFEQTQGYGGTTSSINLDFMYWIFCYHFVFHLSYHVKDALQFFPVFGVISLFVQIQNYGFESNIKSHSMLSPSSASNSTNHSQCLNFLTSLPTLHLLFQWWRPHISPWSSFHAWQWTLALGMWFSIFFPS